MTAADLEAELKRQEEVYPDGSLAPSWCRPLGDHRRVAHLFGLPLVVRRNALAVERDGYVQAGDALFLGARGSRAQRGT